MFTLWSDMDRVLFGGYPFGRYRNRHNYRNSDKNELFVSNNRMNLRDMGEHFEFVAELPGVKEEDLDLTVHASRLILRAKRTLTYEEESTLMLSERKDYDVQRSVSLPVNVDTSQVSALLKDGILRVKLPKSPEHQPRKIAIN